MAGFDAHITFCSTRNLVDTARFYEEILGLPLALDQGACRIYRVTDRAFLGFCEHLEPAQTAGIILTLVTDDVDRWHARLAAQGIAFEKAPSSNPQFKIYNCFLRDPNGYLIEIQRFEDPRWNPGGAP